MHCLFVDNLLMMSVELFDLQPKGVFKMECEVTASPTYGGAGKQGNTPTSKSPASTASRNNINSSSGKSSLHVEFSEMGEVKHNREKYLTAKYGSHQMSLIRKRLSVEMWLYDELQKLYEDEVIACDSPPLDEIYGYSFSPYRIKSSIYILKFVALASKYFLHSNMNFQRNLSS